MQLGMVGLGRMGSNMVRRLLRGGHECVVFDMNPESVKQLEGEGVGEGEGCWSFFFRFSTWFSTSPQFGFEAGVASGCCP